MPFQPTNNLVTQNAGLSPQNLGIPHFDVRDPTSEDANPILYPQGKTWLNTLTGSYFVNGFFTSIAGINTANWTALSVAAGNVTSLTGDSGTATPSSGAIKISGTASEITTAASSHTVTLSIPSAFVAPGSIASTTTISSGTTLHATTSMSAGTTITATLGAITATNGNLVLGTAGNKILSTSVATTTTAGANSFGSVVLMGGTATVNTSAVTANSLIFLSRLSVGSTGAAALGLLSVGTIVGSTSFDINAWSGTDATALAATDVSKICWMIVN